MYGVIFLLDTTLYNKTYKPWPKTHAININYLKKSLSWDGGGGGADNIFFFVSHQRTLQEAMQTSIQKQLGHMDKFASSRVWGVCTRRF